MSALRWVAADRYYRMSVQKDLLGGLSVLCVWGSRRSKQGNHQLIPCEDLAAVRRTVRRIAKLRRQHGYRFAPSARPAKPAARPKLAPNSNPGVQLALW